jgi:AcrR family transcriptional regulator
MIGTKSREIVSRRSRPAKAPLSRDVIVSTALELLGKDGLSGMSLRRVAAALDTGPASLYVYIANLNELYSLMLDQALAAVTLPDMGLSWRDRLKNYLTSYLDVLSERSGLAEVALSTVATGTNSLRMWEVLLGLLKEGGVDDAKLVAGVDMLLLHTTTVAAEEGHRQVVGQDNGRVANALAAASGEQFPLVATLYQQGAFWFSACDDEERFRWALDVIIDGLIANRASDKSPKTRR